VAPVTVPRQADNPLVFRVHQQIEALGIPCRKLEKGTTAGVDTITLLIPVVRTMEHPARFAGDDC
jgi:hypothetical protein